MVVCAGSNRLIVGAGVVGVDSVSAVLNGRQKFLLRGGFRCLIHYRVSQ